jgi:cell division protein FtsB
MLSPPAESSAFQRTPRWLPTGRAERQLMLLGLALYLVLLALGGWLLMRSLQALEQERQAERENLMLRRWPWSKVICSAHKATCACIW